MTSNAPAKKAPRPSRADSEVRRELTRSAALEWRHRPPPSGAPKSGCVAARKSEPLMVLAPWGGQESGGCFDRRPGIAILELLRAEIAQR